MPKISKAKSLHFQVHPHDPALHGKKPRAPRKATSARIAHDQAQVSQMERGTRALGTKPAMTNARVADKKLLSARASYARWASGMSKRNPSGKLRKVETYWIPMERKAIDKVKKVSKNKKRADPQFRKDSMVRSAHRMAYGKV